MFRLHRDRQQNNDLLTSRLVDERGFYESFQKDLRRAKSEVIIECPFVSVKRMNILLADFRSFLARDGRLVVNTKPIDEHEPEYRLQVEKAIADLQQLGVLVLFTDGHHRKLVIIDRKILYEGSLNVLSQNTSCEVMRRIHSENLAGQMLDFLRLKKFID